MGYNFTIDFFLDLVEPLFPYTFDPLLEPLLAIGSPHTGAILTVAVVSIGLSAALMILKYILMDLDKHEEVQTKRKELNKKMKKAQKKGEVDEANKHMQEMMGLQKDLMSLQIKPMLASMVIFFIVLPWMYVTFIPIVDMAPANGDTYTGELVYNGYTQPMEAENRTDTGPAVIVDGEEYTVEETFMMQDLPWKVKKITLAEDEQHVRLAAEIIQLPFSLPWVGDELGWFGTYFLFIIPFTIVFGKLLGIQ